MKCEVGLSFGQAIEAMKAGLAGWLLSQICLQRIGRL